MFNHVSRLKKAEQFPIGTCRSQRHDCNVAECLDRNLLGDSIRVQRGIQFVLKSGVAAVVDPG
nr:hypothetical protein [Tanacetum cinerariifolium]